MELVGFVTMAEEPQYALKRKYEDQPTATDIQLEVANAKQKAQEAAARLLSVTGGAPPLSFDPKRSKSDNGAPQSGFDSYDLKPQYQLVLMVVLVRRLRYLMVGLGFLLGNEVRTIKYLQLQSGAKIQVTRDMDADPNSTTRMVELMGTSDAVASAEKLINEVLAEVCFKFSLIMLWNHCNFGLLVKYHWLELFSTDFVNAM